MQIKGIAMRAVRGLVLAAVLTLAFTAEAQTAASDSLTRALATFWGTSVKSERLSPAENLRFLEGVEAADRYYFGKQRLPQRDRCGNEFPVRSA